MPESGTVDAPAKRTVLVVDDSPDTVEFLRGVLDGEFHVLEAADGKEALALLAQGDRIDAIVSDHNMPGMTGVQLLAQSFATHPHAARVLFTASDRVDDLQEAVNVARVRRFLSKPAKPSQILAAVREGMREASLEEENARLVSELKTSELRLKDEVSRKTRELVDLMAKLEQLALRDGLTGLYNHRFFQDALTSELSRATRYSRDLSLVFLDVDHFKSYNDRNGHPAGDKLLIRLSRILGASIGDDVPDVKIRGRVSDIPARYGGEEFVIILPETAKAGACIRAERIREEVERTEFDDAAGQPGGRVTVSIGVATFPGDALTKAPLIEAADQALLRAKRTGRNRVVAAGDFAKDGA